MNDKLTIFVCGVMLFGLGMVCGAEYLDSQEDINVVPQIPDCLCNLTCPNVEPIDCQTTVISEMVEMQHFQDNLNEVLK